MQLPGNVTYLKPSPNTIDAFQCKRLSMYKTDISEISGSGLRYISKQGGSPFQGAGSTGETIRGTVKRYLNSLLFFCFDCKPEKPVVIQETLTLDPRRISA
jgi:hypothetical protein